MEGLNPNQLDYSCNLIQSIIVVYITLLRTALPMLDTDLLTAVPTVISPHREERPEPIKWTIKK